MADTKWTPGPWESDGMSVGIAGSGWHIGYPPSQGAIASLYDGEYIENGNYEADAHLIAACPDGYTANEMALDYLENHHGNEAARRVVCLAIRAALRKARGES